jgi:hypothetical protein
MIAVWGNSPVGVKLAVITVLGVVPLVGAVYLTYQGYRAPSATVAAGPRAGGMLFTIAGGPQAAPAPGSTVALRLTLTNPHDFPIAVRALTIKVSKVVTHDGSTTRCGADNFAIRQFAGRYGFVIGADRTSDLGGLGFPNAQWPHLVMINYPVNQDACKRALVTLALTATATRTGS